MYQLEELYILLITIYGGIIMGIIYDLYRGIRSHFNKNNLVKMIEDLIFWIIITATCFFLLHKTNAYDLRYYNFTGFIIGIVIYFNTISKYVLRLFIKALQYIINTLVNIYFLAIYPIHFIFDIISYITIKRYKKRKVIK
jgi:spore cortex biosynthesis protein YabQ